MVTGALPTRSVKNHIKEKTEMFSSFKDSTFITHIHARNHANKKCIIRDIKENLGLFLQVLITLPNPNTNRPLKNEKFTPRGPDYGFEVWIWLGKVLGTQDYLPCGPASIVCC